MKLGCGGSRSGEGVTGGLKMGMIAFGESKSNELRKPLFGEFVSPLTELKLGTGGLKLEKPLPGESKMGTNVTGGFVEG